MKISKIMLLASAAFAYASSAHALSYIQQQQIKAYSAKPVVVAKPTTAYSYTSSVNAYTTLTKSGAGTSGYMNKPNQPSAISVYANNYTTKVNSAQAAKNQLYYSQSVGKNPGKNCIITKNGCLY